jgi:hypothetical protein
VARQRNNPAIWLSTLPCSGEQGQAPAQTHKFYTLPHLMDEGECDTDSSACACVCLHVHAFMRLCAMCWCSPSCWSSVVSTVSESAAASFFFFLFFLLHLHFRFVLGTIGGSSTQMGGEGGGAHKVETR